MKSFSLLAATLAATLCHSALAQRAGGPPDMAAVNTTLPEEGAPLAEPGPYAVTIEPAFGAAGLRTLRPTALENFPRRDKLPVVLWGNGGCAMDNPRFNGFLETIASHGFLVITTAAAQSAQPGGAAQAGATAPGGARPPAATAEDMRAGIDWAEKENARAGSPLAGRIDLTQVAAMGQSCGGILALTLGADPRVDTIGVFNSGLQAPGEAASQPGRPTLDFIPQLRGPVLLINGHERDFMMVPARATFDAINHQPVFYGARHGAGHLATAYHKGGGEFANVAANWLRWQFKGDKQAAKMFVGADCSLCTNPNWDTASKGLKE